MSAEKTTEDTTKVSIEAHANKMSAPSFNISSQVARLRMMAASCFFGEPQYYSDGKTSKRGAVNQTSRLSDSAAMYLIDVLKGIVTPTETSGKTSAQALEDAIDRALDECLEGTLNVAVSLRNEDYIRTTPQIILVRAANHESAKGTGLIRKYAPQIIKRTDEPAVQLAYQLHRYGKSVPNSLKKSWKDALEKAPEHILAKYRMENRLVKTIDVVRMSHARTPAIDKLVKDELKLDNSTWESLISGAGSTKENWEKVIDELWVITK